jgi:hypothetical protein
MVTSEALNDAETDALGTPTVQRSTPRSLL